MSNEHRFACGSCNRPLSREDFIEALRNGEKLGPHGIAPVCDVCRDRKAKGLPVERHGEKAKCREEGCPDGDAHVVICLDCKKPVLVENRLAPADAATDYTIHRERKDGLFPHGGHHYACGNEGAHPRLEENQA